MEKPVNIHYAKTHLSRLIDRVREGAEILIAKAGTPVARLVPIVPPGPRRPGGFAFRVEDDFFTPLPEEELKAWEQ